MYVLYCSLLLIWVPLLLPAYRLRGGARLWLLVVIAVGILALVYEIRMYLWSFAAIRLDILLISAALVGFYGSVTALLYGKRWRKSAALLAIALMLIGGGMSYKWMEADRESQRLHAVFEESNRLLFKAKFRSAEFYESYFGPFTDASDGLPVGHWRVMGQSHFTRLIINGQGRVWLFYQCQEDAECHSGPAGSGLRNRGDHPYRWEASLKPQVGEPFVINIVQDDSGTLALEVREQTHRFAKAPPPVESALVPQSLNFLGTYADAQCLRDHVTIRQVWLWEGGTRHYAVGTFSTLVAGRWAGFVRPVVMGEGIGEGDGWRFVWQQDGRSGAAFIALHRGDAILTLDQHGRDLEDADELVLKAGAVFHDERIELAPLTNSADWHHWFDMVLVGHFTSGNAPAC